mmetsp:Transcript_52791/g.115590  ORF Transcript_52791/g.115590 Transcript_52791/m.115590 type:complete len:203 (-) Transcript_52791:111-719(-)
MAEGGVLCEEELTSLVDRITDEGFLDFVDEFVEENAQYFAPESEEHRHYYHEIHERYQRFFESRVEAWLRERGQSPEGFAWAALHGGLALDVAQELLAVADYEAFVAMMLHRRAALELEAEQGSKASLAPTGYAAPLAPVQPVVAAQPTPVVTAQPLRQMQVQVPQGSGPGTQVQVTTPEGILVNVTVPEGCPQGSVFLASY